MGSVYGAQLVKCRRRPRGVAWEECGQRACQLATEEAARRHVDVEVTGVVRHAQLLGDRSHAAVDVEPRPRLVDLPLDVRQVRVALREAEVEDVADGDGECGDDEVERYCE